MERIEHLINAIEAEYSADLMTFVAKEIITEDQINSLVELPADKQRFCETLNILFNESPYYTKPFQEYIDIFFTWYTRKYEIYFACLDDDMVASICIFTNFFGVPNNLQKILDVKLNGNDPDENESP